MITVKQKGDFSKTLKYLNKMSKGVRFSLLEKYAKECVLELANATPKDSGETANSWYFEIDNKRGHIAITFFNKNIQNGIPIAIILQYGHGTRNGGWVEGRDYINPIIQSIFDKLVKELWQEVTKL